MTSSFARIVAGAGFGLAAGFGVILVRQAVTLNRRASLAARLDPYLGAVLSPPSAAPWWAVTATRLLGGEDDLQRHLRAAGYAGAVVEFRARQGAAWAITSAGLALLAFGLRAAGAPVALGGGVASAMAGGVVGPVVMQARVRALARRRRLTVEVELPAVAGMMGLCLAAGETLRSAVERTAVVAGGALGAELRRVSDEVRGGMALADSLTDLSHRLDVVAASRLIESLQLARERGVPVAGVLRAQAGDLRSAATQRLIEVSARRQVYMLVPVVFLILPVCVLFAFYPGLVSLRLLST